MGATGPGDPLTPGFPSIDGIYRQPLNESGLPTIPAFALSYGDAQEILRRMKGEYHTAFSKFFFWSYLQRWTNCRQNYFSDRLLQSSTPWSWYVWCSSLSDYNPPVLRVLASSQKKYLCLYAISVLLKSFSWWINTVLQWDFFNQSHPSKFFANWPIGLEYKNGHCFCNVQLA